MYQCNVTLLDLVGELARLVTAELWKEEGGGVICSRLRERTQTPATNITISYEAIHPSREKP